MYRQRLFVSALLPCFIVLLGCVRPGLTIEPIQEAFGMKLGVEVAPTEDSLSYNTLDGAWAYFFTPVHPSPLFDFYVVHITPVTHLIHTITAVGQRHDIQTCQKDRAALMPLLTETYGPSTKLGPVHISDFDIDSEAIVQAGNRRWVGIACGGTSPIILHMMYVDMALVHLAEQERLQLEREKLHTRSL